jgi:AraC-like DNA-binding protein
MDRYSEAAPPPALRGVVRALWRIDRVTDGEHVILPDAATDIVIRDGEAIAAGVDTAPSTVPAHAGSTILGIRLRPGAVPDVLGVAADELKNLRVPLADLWGADGRALAEDPLGVLIRRLRGAGPADAAAATAAGLIERGTPLRRAADAVELSERQLRRRFTIAVGYGPKTFARIVRFQRALARIRSGDELAAAAAATGYADQAHMTREVGEFTGRTPTGLR